MSLNVRTVAVIYCQCLGLAAASKLGKFLSCLHANQMDHSQVCVDLDYQPMLNRESLCCWHKEDVKLGSPLPLRVAPIVPAVCVPCLM